MYNQKLSSLDGLEAGQVIKEKVQLIDTIDSLTREVQNLAEQQEMLMDLKNNPKLLENLKQKVKENESKCLTLRNFFKPTKRKLSKEKEVR